MKLLLVAAVALIDAQSRLLLAKRPAGKTFANLWEFPGGKVESGETPEEALKRELFEELAIEINETDLVPLNFASMQYPDFHLLMPLWELRKWNGAPVAQEGQELAWVRAAELDNLNVPPADVALKEFMKHYLAAH